MSNMQLSAQNQAGNSAPNYYVGDRYPISCSGVGGSPKDVFNVDIKVLNLRLESTGIASFYNETQQSKKATDVLKKHFSTDPKILQDYLKKAQEEDTVEVKVPVDLTNHIDVLVTEMQKIEEKEKLHNGDKNDEYYSRIGKKAELTARIHDLVIKTFVQLS